MSQAAWFMTTTTAPTHRAGCWASNATTKEELMAEGPDWTRYGGFILAALSALGGFLGSAMNQASEDAQVKTKLEQLATAFHDHDKNERDNDLRVSERLANIEARVQMLEKSK